MAKFLCLLVLSLVAISLTTGAESEDHNEIFKTDGVKGAETQLVKREAIIQRNGAEKKPSQKKRGNTNNLAGKSLRAARKRKANKIDASGKSTRTSKYKKDNKKKGSEKSSRTINKNEKRKNLNKKNTGGKSSRKVNQEEGEVASRQNTDDDCVSLLKKYARTNEKKATAVQTQVNRIRSFSDIQTKKQAKKGNFEEPLTILLKALGGDISNPTCEGVPIDSTDNSAYKTDLETLAACDANIDAVCGDLANGNETENTMLTACLDAAVQFKAEFAECTDNKVTDTCTCIDGIDKDNLDVLSDCDTAAMNLEATQKKKACLESFQECKTAQDNSASGVDQCKETNQCPPTPGTTEATTAGPFTTVTATSTVTDEATTVTDEATTVTTEITTGATTETTVEASTEATTPSVTTASPVQNKRYLRDILKNSIGNRK